MLTVIARYQVQTGMGEQCGDNACEGRQRHSHRAWVPSGLSNMTGPTR